MSKRTVFTTVTPLPPGITRETVLETLHNHVEMIDLNPLVTERHPIKPPPEATAEEFHAQWYSVTDKINYLPAGLYSGAVTFSCCFHDLPDGLQTHIHAPMGLNIKGRWTLGGTLPGEPRQPVELGLGVPKTGLWLREDVDMKVNFMMTKFVKANTKKAHGTLVGRLIEKAHLVEADIHNSGLAEQLSLREQYPPDYHSGIVSPTQQNSQLFDGKPLNLPGANSPPPPVHHPATYTLVQSPGHPSPAYAAASQSSYFPPHGQTSPDPRLSDPRLSYGHAPYPSSHRSSGGPGSYTDSKHDYQRPTSLNVHPPAMELPNQDSKTPVELAGSSH